MNTNSKFPSEADVVIVGVGGIVGSMLAYWLADLGEKNVAYVCEGRTLAV